jgi:NitT/TauT family transport system permease protein
VVGFWYLMTTPGPGAELHVRQRPPGGLLLRRTGQGGRRIWTWFVADADIYRHLAVTLIETLLAFGAGSVLGLAAGCGWR